MLSKYLTALLLGIGLLALTPSAQAAFTVDYYYGNTNPGNNVAPGPKTYAILVGSQSPSNGVIDALRGDLDVNNVASQLSWAANVKVLKYQWEDFNFVAGDIQAAASSIASVVKPGDSFIFYYSGHGTGGPGEGVQDFINPVRSGGCQDNTLASIFSGGSFAEVNKYFLIDACHSEGMWMNDSAGDRDLQTLAKISFLGSSSEGNVAYSNPANGTSFFTNAILPALTPDATFGNLLARAMGAGGEVTGFYKDDGYGTGAWQPVAYTSGDFDPNLPLKGGVVPEPTALALMLTAAAAFLVWRRRAD
ncbi:MAG: caspase family protein [Pirellulales bacterium]|nr:caspase family protein [Pirellulales bacterium]